MQKKRQSVEEFLEVGSDSRTSSLESFINLNRDQSLNTASNQIQRRCLDHATPSPEDSQQDRNTQTQIAHKDGKLTFCFP